MKISMRKAFQSANKAYIDTYSKAIYYMADDKAKALAKDKYDDVLEKYCNKAIQSYS